MSPDDLDATLYDLVNTEGVLSAYSTQQARDTIDSMLDSLGTVIWIIVIMAALLAIVVLYSLANINVIERTRELATIDVLGFYKKEIYSYILQENILLTVIGILLGIPVGIFFHAYVISAVEGNDVMLAQAMNPLSILISGVFTLVAMLIVNLLMRPTINRIDPALSLKSIQ
jgi:putative ABC transport system permease protein